MRLRTLGSALFCTIALTTAANRATALDADPTRWTLQGAYIAVAGSTNGSPDGCSDGRCNSFIVTVLDTANNVAAGVNITIDFSGCPDIQIACDQLTAVTGQTGLAGKKVVGYSNALGQFTFRVIGAANATPMPTIETSSGTNVGVPCAQAYADGVPLTPRLIVSAYDINGLGSPGIAVNGADVALVAAEAAKSIQGALSRARDDYNGNNTVTGGDVSISAQMAAQAMLGTGSQNTGSYCP